VRGRFDEARAGAILGRFGDLAALDAVPVAALMGMLAL